MNKLFHLFGSHEAPQIEINNAHDNSVWDLAWHPVGYLLCRYLAVYFQSWQLTLFLICCLLCSVLHIVIQQIVLLCNINLVLEYNLLCIVWPYLPFALAACELIKKCLLYFFGSGGNDHATKFWCRNRPGDITRDRYNSGQTQG